MLESVFFLNVEACGVSDSLGERINIFSAGNVEVSSAGFSFPGT